ncbi:glycine cleavage system aminomethyltransferase GcvT [Saccharopolyspora sp. NFXS83]|uniref:glycine cleavage system aminomethyltransferase GcvT n=1 Tax=Saccharopolyspora sp. NFXS83 TaxID=2993560 RepID=UPI00224B9110|nr:glycine cleavage system aminomethyltransferase GcvT [Saccharopolyspora sp. NFXS83]MCX2729951.1 glycine cleavage system aminomethyltransferase GcvT [Saccharopolyspora sp. NFXS83]
MTSSSPSLRETPLGEIHASSGAHFTEFAGWRMPVRYTGDTAEHQAVRTAAGLFDLSHMGEIKISGPQAAEALDYALVAKASTITEGRARYTMLCNADGGVLDDLIVYRLGEQEYLVVANAANAAVVSAELADRVDGFDATHEDVSDDYALIAVQGPKAVEILAPLTGTDLSGVKYYAGYPSTVADADVLLARTGYTGEDGFELFTSPADAPAVWRALAESGAAHGLIPAGLSCRDTLRLEAGMPLYGNELSASLTPFHANLGRVVKLDKPGDFVGKEALAKVAEAPTERTLVGLRTDARRAPRHGYRVLDTDGTEIGEVTSGAPSPTLGHPIAMAYVDRAHSAPGTALQVDIRGKSIDVEVVELPFYRRSA